MRKEKITILTDTKEVYFNAEIPQTDGEFINGLAFRDFIPAGTGMLYDFSRYGKQTVNMYTPDTRFPVDFLFIDENTNILKISTAKPLSKQLHSCENVKAVLEINAGEAAKSGIKAGDRVISSVTLLPDILSEIPYKNTEYFCYDRQVFASAGNVTFMYSYGVHSWVNFNSNKKAFENKIEKLKEMGFTSSAITEKQAYSIIGKWERNYNLDYAENLCRFFIAPEYLLTKYIPAEEKYYFYVFGKDWEEITWRDDKKELGREIFIPSIRVTKQETDDFISAVKNERTSALINSENKNFLKKPEFFGEHFEAFGNMWEALGVNTDDDSIEKKVREMCSCGTFYIPEKNDYIPPSVPLTRKNISDKLLYTYLPYNFLIGYYPSVKEDFKMIILNRIGQENGKANYIYEASYPFMEGITNEVVIDAYYQWKDFPAGESCGDFNNALGLSWFDPIFIHDSPLIKNAKKYKVNFSALAYSLEKVKDEIITVDKGGVYEVQLERFLKENPDKTAKDMPPVKLNLGTGTVFLPTGYAAEFQYQSKILSVDKLYFGKDIIYKMQVIISQDVDDKNFYANLYAHESILNGYIPNKGDMVRGIFWLHGHLEIK